MAKMLEISNQFRSAADIEAVTPITVGANIVGPDGRGRSYSRSCVLTEDQEEPTIDDTFAEVIDGVHLDQQMESSGRDSPIGPASP